MWSGAGRAHSTFRPSEDPRAGRKFSVNLDSTLQLARDRTEALHAEAARERGARLARGDRPRITLTERLLGALRLRPHALPT